MIQEADFRQLLKIILSTHNDQHQIKEKKRQLTNHRLMNIFLVFLCEGVRLPEVLNQGFLSCFGDSLSPTAYAKFTVDMS